MLESKLKLQVDAADGAARACTVDLPRGQFQTPTFMPVATRASMRGITSQQLKATGSQIMLSNTFHLMDRPGCELIQSLGGIHKFANWNDLILTDSGGFQAFSLGSFTKKIDNGFIIASPRDGTRHTLTPKTVITAQLQLQTDIAMVIDDCPALPASDRNLQKSVEKTLQWAEECKRTWSELQPKISPHSSLFCIVQGGTNIDLRSSCAKALMQHEWAGYAIGGLSVGEKKEQMLRTLELMNAILPNDKPRYLMGVGKPIDMLRAIDRGIDMMDCVLPARNGRNGHIYTSTGLIRLKNQQYFNDMRPLDESCIGPCCENISRAYLHHLFREKEMLGPILASLHNIYHYQDLMNQCREHIVKGTFQTLLAHYELLYSNQE